MYEYLTTALEIWVKPNTPAFFNISGLLFDIVGVIILFKFGLPADIRRDGVTLLETGQTNEEEVSKAVVYDRWSLSGLCILIFGFLMQAAGNAALLV